MEHHDFLRLQVFTRSGMKLGRITGFEIETESQMIRAYFVKAGRLRGILPGSMMLISRDQVISIADDKMIVEDAALMTVNKTVPSESNGI